MRKFFVPLLGFIFLAQFSTVFAAGTPPDAPRGFDAAGGTPYNLVLTWTNPTAANLDHINVYLSYTGGYAAPNVWAAVAAQPNTKGTYTINNLSSGTNYFLYLAAVDSSGNISAYTTEIERTTATTPNITSAAAATNFTAQDLATDGAIKLLWTDPADSIFFQVHLYRATTSGFTPDATNEIAQVFGLPSGAGSYMDSGLTNGTIYYYEIRTETNRGILQTGLFYPSASATPTKAVAVTPSQPTTTTTTTSTTTAPAAVSLVDSQGNAIVDGDAIKTADNPDVYIIKLIGTKKFRRLILNPAVFNSYGQLSWNKIKIVSQEVMNAYTISTLVIEVNADGSVANPKVFSLSSSANADIGQKQWLNMTAAQFEAKGYDWDAIYKINHNEAGIYAAGSEIAG